MSRFVLLGKFRMDYYLRELTSEGGITIDACCPLVKTPGANDGLLQLAAVGRATVNQSSSDTFFTSAALGS